MLANGTVNELRTEGPNRARDIIENFMVAANGVTASSCRRQGAVDPAGGPLPKRWPRIVDLARQHRDDAARPTPDARALEKFLRARRAAAPEEFADLSLSMIKLLGRGEYVAEGPGGRSSLHFALAVSNYTHSTAPNRRFPDLVTQRMLKAAIGRRQAPYALGRSLQARGTLHEAGGRGQQGRAPGPQSRRRRCWMSNRVGQDFDAVVTGASDKGTWVRILTPPVEGKLERGTEGLDVGDRLRVRLLRTDADRGFVDFARV